MATANGARNETAPIAMLARHSRRNWGTSTSAPARNVRTTPANEPTNASQSGTVTVKTLPTTTPAASSIRATESPISTETVLAIRIVTASTAASASSLTAPPSGHGLPGGRGHQPVRAVRREPHRVDHMLADAPFPNESRPPGRLCAQGASERGMGGRRTTNDTGSSAQPAGSWRCSIDEASAHVSWASPTTGVPPSAGPKMRR